MYEIIRANSETTRAKRQESKESAERAKRGEDECFVCAMNRPDIANGSDHEMKTGSSMKEFALFLCLFLCAAVVSYFIVVRF